MTVPSNDITPTLAVSHRRRPPRALLPQIYDIHDPGQIVTITIAANHGAISTDGWPTHLRRITPTHVMNFPHNRPKIVPAQLAPNGWRNVAYRRADSIQARVERWTTDNRDRFPANAPNVAPLDTRNYGRDARLADWLSAVERLGYTRPAFERPTPRPIGDRPRPFPPALAARIRQGFWRHLDQVRRHGNTGPGNTPPRAPSQLDELLKVLRERFEGCACHDGDRRPSVEQQHDGDA